jgi:uncharacterized repeat protein (TIGR03803 family)
LAGTAIATGSQASAGSYRVVYDFKGGSDGALPTGLLNVDNTLYGPTAYGGGSTECDQGCGTVFEVNPATGAETVIYAFTGGRHGASPNSSLLSVGRKLYGATAYSGRTANCDVGCGTVFEINPTSGKEKVVYRFKGGSDGALPSGPLNVGGTFYGTSIEGGGAAQCSNGCGTLFAVNPKTGAETVVYAFQGGSDGASPSPSPINVGGTLYGTTSSGGSFAEGTVFAVNPATGGETVVYAFQGGSDGAAPVAGLINVGGMLYGTTREGGGATQCRFGCGTVFEVNPTTGAETVVHAFADPHQGYQPEASLIKVGDKLYGTTYFGGRGGKHGYGTVFEVNLTTGEEEVVYSFENGSNGAYPSSGLINVAGTLYGTAANTVFALTP